MAVVAAMRGELAQAARLFGASDALLVTLGDHLDVGVQAVCDRHRTDIRSRLGEARFATALAEGRSVSTEAMIAEALRVGA